MNTVLKIILTASVFVIINLAVKQIVHVTCSQETCTEKVNNDHDVKTRINHSNEKYQFSSEQSNQDGKMIAFSMPELVRLECKDKIKRKNYR